MIEIIVPIVTAVLGSSALSVVATALVNRSARKREAAERVDKCGALMQAAMKLLLRDKLEYLTIQAIRTGEVTLSHRRFIREMWTIYEGLGGNGELTALMESLDELPLKGD